MNITAILILLTVAIGGTAYVAVVALRELYKLGDLVERLRREIAVLRVEVNAVRRMKP